MTQPQFCQFRTLQFTHIYTPTNFMFIIPLQQIQMFISSIMRSPTFPPNDGWMAGYSISYYYFGYFMAAMLATASGIGSTIAFNLTISLTNSTRGSFRRATSADRCPGS